MKIHEYQSKSLFKAAGIAVPDGIVCKSVDEVVAAFADLGGTLAVADLRSDAFPSRMPGGSMHVYDYSLFHMNIRENAATRVEAFLATR